MRARGVKSRMCPPNPQRDRKRPTKWGGVSESPYKKGGAGSGTLKNHTKCLWRWEPDRRSNFFFSPPAHLCNVTYMTEISLIVTLNNQFTNHRAAKRRGDKFDRSMTRGKLLRNIPTLFIFNFYSNDEPRD